MARRNLPQQLRLATSAACILLGVGSPAAASAQVLEIGPAGVSSISGPSVITPGGVRAIYPDRSDTPPGGGARSAPASVRPLLEQAGEATRLSPRLLEAVAYVESRFRHTSLSPKGAVGMMQLMPSTALSLGVDPTDASQNAHGGAAYLRRMLVLFDNDIELAVAAYNAGPEAVKKYGGVPPYAETRRYVEAVMDYLARTSVPETR